MSVEEYEEKRNWHTLKIHLTTRRKGCLEKKKIKLTRLNGTMREIDDSG